jgi:hypothetical protein
VFPYQVTSYPTSPEVTSCLTELKEQLFFFVASKQEGRIDGYFVDNEETPSSSELLSFHTSHLWHVSFPKATEKLVSVIPKSVNGEVQMTPYPVPDQCLSCSTMLLSGLVDTVSETLLTE